MPRTETILSIFLSSPGNVLEERESVREIVEWINTTLARRTGVRLELLTWEEHTSPEFGEDAQSVINEQIPDDYDIYLGILWHSVGTQTPSAESGTIDEFERALQRFESDPSSIRIKLYFKVSGPASLDDIDPEQLRRAQEFRSKVKELGLYWKFNSRKQFEDAVRKHLTQIVVEPAPHIDQPVENSESTEGKVDSSLAEDDEGLMELEDTFFEEMRNVREVLERMSIATAEIGDRMNQRASSMQQLNEQGIVPRPAAKQILKKSSGDMDNFGRAMRSELPLYKQHLDKGFDAFAKAVPIYLELDQDRANMAGTVMKMSESMSSMLESVEQFRNTVVGLPRLTTALNKSKRSTAEALQQVIDITRAGKASLDGMLAFLG